MFQVAEILRRGWWNTRLKVVATEHMLHEEQRLRYSGLKVVRIETWRIEVRVGEAFDIDVPRSVNPKVGDGFTLAGLMHNRAFRSKWSRTSAF